MNLSQLRANSPIEARVDAVLRSRGVRRVRQYPIGPYRADFWLPAWNLVVECDGRAFHKSNHHQVARDRRRDAYMRARGYRVVRLSGREIHRSADAAVARAISGTRKITREVISGGSSVTFKKPRRSRDVNAVESVNVRRAFDVEV